MSDQSASKKRKTTNSAIAAVIQEYYKINVMKTGFNLH